jgi:hypothetical protein
MLVQTSAKVECFARVERRVDTGLAVKGVNEVYTGDGVGNPVNFICAEEEWPHPGEISLAQAK